MGIREARVRLRSVLSSMACTPAAPIFDPLSARIAEAVGWELCKLSGSVWKAAHLGIPDDLPLANLSDLVDVCQRIRRLACDISLVVDADDAGGSPLATWRTVTELEAAGVSGIEIEDTAISTASRSRRGVTSNDRRRTRHQHFLATDLQVANLRAAVAARRDPETVIIARTSALTEFPTEEALRRIHEYGQTGADAIMLPSYPPRGRADIEAVSLAAGLPMLVLGLPPDLVQDAQFLAKNQVRVRYLRQSVYQDAVRAIHERLSSLQQGGSTSGRGDATSPELLELVNRTAEFVAWEGTYEPEADAGRDGSAKPASDPDSRLP